MTTDTTPDLRRLAAEMATFHRVFRAGNDDDTPDREASDDAAFEHLEAVYARLIAAPAATPADVLVKLEAAKAYGELYYVRDTPLGDLIDAVMRDLRAMTA